VDLGARWGEFCGGAAGGVTAIPREAREGLLRAWLKVLSDRHPDVTWVPAPAAHEISHKGEEVNEDVSY
jgi:hypothetical protein